MASVVPLENGDHMALFHDDGRFLRNDGRQSSFHVYKTISRDGGLTWSAPIVVATHPDADLCEPGAIRSPDGRTIALLLRDNSRRHNSFVVFTTDEGETWSAPRELPAALTGDRHTAVYAADGRLVVMFRNRRPVPKSESNHEKGGIPVWGSGKTTVWVGRYEDILKGREGQYLVSVLGYGGYGKLQRLPDGTILGITYCRYPYDRKATGDGSSIVTTRFKLEETDALLTSGRQLVEYEGLKRPAEEGKEEDAQLLKENE